MATSDASELASVLGAMSEEADAVELDLGHDDGVSSPIIYTLQHPITFGAESSEKVSQIEFVSRRLGDISVFLDARGEGNEFKASMRSFGTLLGVKLPMTDSIIDALDFVDFLVIKRAIMGKLAMSRGRWKKIST